MGSEIPRQPDTAPPAPQRRPGSAAGQADMVIKAAATHAMVSAREADARSYRAMAVRDGHIVALTAEPDGADDLIGAGTVVIDDPGLTVLPTCDDTHTHLIFAGRAANDVQVADARNLGEFLDLIASRAATTADGQWIRTALNWHELQLAQRRLPNLQELDSAALDNPVLVKRGGHNDLINSAGLRLAGVTAQTRAPEGGVIDRDTTGSRPAGSRTARSHWSSSYCPRQASASRWRACGRRQPDTPPPASARSGTRPSTRTRSRCCGPPASAVPSPSAPRPW
jgi:amidohydrolase family protein